MNANLVNNIIAICTAMSFSLLSCFTYAEASMDDGAIKSPDGLYVVGEYTVTQIKVTEPPINGQYKFNSYIIEKASTYSTDYKYSEFSKRNRVGDHLVNGLWVTDSQQFHESFLTQIPKANQCSFWSDPTWSFSHIPTTVNLDGRKVSAWKSINSHSNNRVPKAACETRQTNIMTCRFECLKWTEPTPSSYIFEKKNDALEYLRNEVNKPTAGDLSVEQDKDDIKRSQLRDEYFKEQAEKRKAKQKQAEDWAKARAKEKADKKVKQEEQRLENKRKAEEKKATQKKNSEYDAAWQTIIKKRTEKLSKLDREYREKLGAPPRRYRYGDQVTSIEDQKAEALSYAEARKNKKPTTMSREERRAASLAYAEARKKVEMEYQEAKAKILKDKQ